MLLLSDLYFTPPSLFPSSVKQSFTSVSVGEKDIFLFHVFLFLCLCLCFHIFCQVKLFLINLFCFPPYCLVLLTFVLFLNLKARHLIRLLPSSFFCLVLRYLPSSFLFSPLLATLTSPLLHSPHHLTTLSPHYPHPCIYQRV